MSKHIYFVTTSVLLAAVFGYIAWSKPPGELSGAYWLLSLICACEVPRYLMDEGLQAMRKRLRAADERLISELRRCIELHEELAKLDADRIAELEAMLPEATP